jgi:alkanesulfonate monooxygenase SsuD/methylene tetrahydromethanopterin reductase-like flavin-dependent oxidoreductase (luciferase family)
MVERARAAAEAGLDSLFVGDHHGTPSGGYYQSTPILGRLLAEWDRAGSVPERKAGALFLLPLWNPVLVAEQIGTLASATTSRFVMQTAIGGGDAQFAAMGVPLRGRSARFEQGLDVVRRLLAGEAVSARIGDLTIVDAQVSPVTPEPLEVWVGGSADTAIARAARIADGWLANAHHTHDELRAQAAYYLEQCAGTDRVPTAVAVRRDVHVGAGRADAARVAEPVIAGGYRGFRPNVCVYGSVAAVAEQLGALADLGYTDVIVRELADEQSDALASLDRIGEVRELVADVRPGA